MKNLNPIIRYECMTSLKYLLFFYPIQYGIIALISLIIGIGTGNFEDVGTNSLEINSIIYVGILGVLGFKEDFKMLIQNGYTRKYIFIATLSMFCFISGTMALVDMIVGNVIHHLNNNYASFYGAIYGYGNFFMNWLWLFLVYVFVCSLLYLVILIISKVGKNVSIYLGIGLGGIVLLIVALFRYVFSAQIVNNIMEFLTKAVGFMTDGTINYLFPVLSLFVLATVLGFGSYVVIRHTELN